MDLTTFEYAVVFQRALMCLFELWWTSQKEGTRSVFQCLGLGILLGVEALKVASLPRFFPLEFLNRETTSLFVEARAKVWIVIAN